jgi:hypothetical protein
LEVAIEAPGIRYLGVVDSEVVDGVDEQPISPAPATVDRGLADAAAGSDRLDTQPGVPTVDEFVKPSPAARLGGRELSGRRDGCGLCRSVGWRAFGTARDEPVFRHRSWRDLRRQLCGPRRERRYEPIDHGGRLYADSLSVSPWPDEDVVDTLIDLLAGLDGCLRVAGRDGYGCPVAAGGGAAVLAGPEVLRPGSRPVRPDTDAVAGIR